MLSASGGVEPLIEDLDAGFSITSRGDEFSVDYLTCRLANLCVSAHGTVNVGRLTPPAAARAGRGLPLAAFLAGNYLALSREFTRAQGQLAALDHPILTAVLVPSDTRAAIVHATLYALGAKVAAPVALQAGELRASSRFPLLGGPAVMTSAQVVTESLRVGGAFGAAGVRARIRGSLQIESLAFHPRELDVTAGTLSLQGLFVTGPIAQVHFEPQGQYTVELSGGVLGRPAGLRAAVDLPARAARVAFDASLSPRLLEPISERTGYDLRHFADLQAPVEATGLLRLAPGWKFADLHARVDTGPFVAYHVAFSQAHATLDLSPQRLRVTDAFGVSGENDVNGSYEQDFTTQDFRYLVWGHLRPLDISDWFNGDWWTGIFGNFAFPAEPPTANLDISGRYSRVRRFNVFGQLAVKGPVLKGIPVDRLQLILYVNEFGANGLTVDATKGAGAVKGTFRLATEPTQGQWTALDLEAAADVDPALVAPILPDAATAAIRDFAFDRAPAISLHGHFDGPDTAPVPHFDLHLVLRDPAPVRIHGVPFENAAFRLDLVDQALDLADIEAGFAGGLAKGEAHADGPEGDRRLRFKAALTGASLGQAAAAASGYVLAAPAKTASAMALFAKDKSGVRLDLNVAAAGQLGKVATFAGDGSVQLQGAQLGQVALFGGLSRVLKFPELRFTQARSSVKISNGLLEFPDLTVKGANSQIQAKGTYAIDRHELDFTATIYPFMESGSLLQIFNALSAPLSAVLRVRLTGTIEDPAWRLAYSPLNLLRVGDNKGGSGKTPAPDSDAVPAD
jgi:hypothetical protein